MENELLENTEINDIFQIDYKNQNLHNNIQFQKWKQSILKKYGNDVKFFKCTKDRILFFSSNIECKKYPFYKSNCPLCHLSICYFCSKLRDNKYREYGECCLFIRIIYMFLKDGFKYINPVGDDRNYIHPNEGNWTLKLHFIPILNIFIIIGEINYSFYFKLYKKDSEIDSTNDYYISYENWIEKKSYKAFIFLHFINVAFYLYY